MSKETRTMHPCDDDNLSALLKDGEQAMNHEFILEHLEQCSRCQQRYDELAAASQDWTKARQALLVKEPTVDFEGESSRCQYRANIERNPIAWTESMAQKLLSPPSHPEMLGRIGRYDVERLIGSGGMGVVFKAYDTELNRPVAVKLLAPYLAENGSARKRFAREARAAAAVVDEHVVAIHNVESGDDPEKPPFLVMKYIAGGSLQQRLDRDGPLEVCEILRIGMQTAKGLAAAHAQGLIHRDVKPSNILLDEGVERALLTDFGLARAEDDACLTRSGFHPGTPHYMSPEQVRGEAIDGRSDLFSLGCVLYALCTGHPPFRAESSYAVLRRITDDAARPIREINPDIPEWLERIVMKLLSKSRDNRFDSATEVAGVLQSCLAHLHQPLENALPMIAATPTTDLSGWTNCLYSSPERLQGIAGHLAWNTIGQGKARLTDTSIEVIKSHAVIQAIPLSSIENVSVSHFSRFRFPIRMDHLRIEYRDGVKNETLLLTPCASFWWTLSGNDGVQMWASQLSQATAKASYDPPKSTIKTWIMAAFAFSFFLAGIFIVLETNKGTLTIQCEADDVPIRIMQGDTVVEQLTVSQAGKSIRIAAGNYVIEVDQSFDAAVVDGGKVSLKRGETETVRVTMTEKEKNFTLDGFDGLSGFEPKGEHLLDAAQGSAEVPPTEVPAVEADRQKGNIETTTQRWNQYGVTPSPVTDTTARILEWMGLHLVPIDKSQFRGENLASKYDSGLDVQFVRVDGPAEKSGFNEVDIVVTLQGSGMSELHYLDKAIQEVFQNATKGQPAKLCFEVLRNGKAVEVSITLPESLGTVSESLNKNLFDSETTYLQIKFQFPRSSKALLVTRNGTENALPTRMNFAAGQTYHFSLSNIPSQQALRFSGSLELLPLNERSRAYLDHNAIPIAITNGDIDQCNSSNFIEKAIYLPISDYARPVLGGLETLESTLAAPIPDLEGEARRRGELIAMVRMRSDVPHVKLPNDETDGSEQYRTADEIWKNFRRELMPTDRTIQVFALAEESAKQNQQVPNLLHLLAALLRNNGPAAIAVGEVLEDKELTLSELILRCDEAAKNANANSTAEWTQVRNAAEATARQWKHDYLSVEHLLMALLNEGTITSQFLQQQGSEAKAVRDTLYQMQFGTNVQAPVVPIP